MTQEESPIQHPAEVWRNPPPLRPRERPETELGTPTDQLEALVAKYPSDRGAWRRALESVFRRLDTPEGYTTTPTNARINPADHRFGQPHDGVLYCMDKGCNTSITVEAYGQDAFGNLVW